MSECVYAGNSDCVEDFVFLIVDGGNLYFWNNDVAKEEPK